jgi:hypothetical protein
MNVQPKVRVGSVSSRLTLSVTKKSPNQLRVKSKAQNPIAVLLLCLLLLLFFSASLKSTNVIEIKDPLQKHKCEKKFQVPIQKCRPIKVVSGQW